MVVRNEEKCFGFCEQMYGVLEGENGTSSSFRFVAAY